MTDANFCCLCASDEGVFLDIFTANDRQLGNRSFLKEFETCLSVKVIQDEALSSRICHRCAIELGQCNEFVEKYHRVYEASLRLNRSVLKKSCCFCLSTAKNNCLFTLAKDFRSRIDPLQKIYECFNRQITREEAERRSICLFCRYNLDLLYDLRKLAREVNSKLKKIAESKAILANLPKTKTFVVNRKTTVICQTKIELETKSESDFESGCSTMARKRSSSKKLDNRKTAPVELKLRTCGQCHTSIEGGIDMYRLHSTGITICKMCWITMDPFNPSSRAGKRKRQNQIDAKNTRLCAVFLTDVLSPASSKDNSPLKVEKDEKGNPVYVLSSDSSDMEEKFNSSKKRQHCRGAELASEESDTNSRMKLKRGFKNDETIGGGGSNKKLKCVGNEETIVSSNLRRSARYQSSDSDSAKAKSKQSDVSDAKNETGNKAKNFTKVNDDHSRDKMSKTKSNKNDGKRRVGANADSIKSKSEDSEASSGDGGVGRKLRKVRNKVPLNVKAELTESPKSEKNPKHPEPKTRPAPSQSPTVSENSSIQPSAKSQSSTIKLSPKESKTLMMVSFPFKLKDPYECKVCRTEYKNKVIGMKHELTHFKQVEIKIEKLNITHHFQNVNQNSTTNELPDDDTSSLHLPSTNEKPLQSDIPTSTSLPGIDEDRDEGPDHKPIEEESIQRSKSSESIQQDDQSPDINDAKEMDVASSVNGHPLEESALEVSDLNKETLENVASSELPTETNEESKEVEADSATETNVTDENSAAKEAEETKDENKREEPSEESDKTVNNIEGKEKDAQEKDDQGVDTPLPETAFNKDEKVEKNGDSGEEMESDTDIRIVDSGSSVEDSNERTEKVVDGTNIVNNVSPKEEKEDKPTDANEEMEPSDEKKAKDALIDEMEAEVTSTIALENNLDERNESNDVSSQNDAENHKDCELNQKIEDEVRPQTAVSEILQEVIDLATAEVQKRVESEVVSLPETVENISEEIKKTAEGSVTAGEILASFDAATNKEMESYKLDLNSTTDSLKDHLEVSTSDI